MNRYLGVKMVVGDFLASSVRVSGTIAVAAMFAVGCGPHVETNAGPVPFERIAKAQPAGDDWLTYAGSYSGQRFSGLTQIGRSNVASLRKKWDYVFPEEHPIETTPIVVDGLMLVTKPPSRLIALDASTGDVRWEYEWKIRNLFSLCCGMVNRGVAVLDDIVYMGTLDGHLVAVDLRTGAERWSVQVVDSSKGYSITAAPLALRGLVLTGTAVESAVGFGEPGEPFPESRGRISAYDARTGERRWTFYPVPEPGQPGSETWGTNDFWRIAGSSTWLTGSYDPELDLVYWGTGAPNYPQFPKVRPGDNLYTASVVALEASTGRLRWHFQFTPGDTHDWDSAQTMVLADVTLGGVAKKLLLTANRNGFFYALDRVSGEFLHAKAFSRQTWADGIDRVGRPIKKADIDPSVRGATVSPANDGGTNWWPPSFSPRTNLFYVTARDSSETYFVPEGIRFDSMDDLRQLPALLKDPDKMKQIAAAMTRRIAEGAVHAVRAIDPATADVRWQFPLPGHSTSGILTTAGDLLFTGSTEADFWALDASTGARLWHQKIGGWVHAGPVTYTVNGRQQVTVASSAGVYTFGLP